MEQKNKYFEFDKSISKKIMKEFKGKIFDVVCNVCNNGKHKSTCINCNGEGHYLLEY